MLACSERAAMKKPWHVAWEAHQSASIRACDVWSRDGPSGEGGRVSTQHPATSRTTTPLAWWEEAETRLASEVPPRWPRRGSGTPPAPRGLRPIARTGLQMLVQNGARQESAVAGGAQATHSVHYGEELVLFTMPWPTR